MNRRQCTNVSCGMVLFAVPMPLLYRWFDGFRHFVATFFTPAKSETNHPQQRHIWLTLWLRQYTCTLIRSKIRQKSNNEHRKTPKKAISNSNVQERGWHFFFEAQWVIPWMRLIGHWFWSMLVISDFRRDDLYIKFLPSVLFALQWYYQEFEFNRRHQCFHLHHSVSFSFFSQFQKESAMKCRQASDFLFTLSLFSRVFESWQRKQAHRVSSSAPIRDRAHYTRIRQNKKNPNRLSLKTKLFFHLCPSMTKR